MGSSGQQHGLQVVCFERREGLVKEGVYINEERVFASLRFMTFVDSTGQSEITSFGDNSFQAWGSNHPGLRGCREIELPSTT